MSKKTGGRQLCFVDEIKLQNHFLVEVVTYESKHAETGEVTEELKFIFNAKGNGTGYVYSPDGTVPSKDGILGIYSEISYHSDGSVLWKLYPNSSTVPKHVNAFGVGERRTTLVDVTDWTPIIRYTVVDYEMLLKRKATSPILLFQDSPFFNGEPFVCLIYMGRSDCVYPVSKDGEGMIFRVPGVAKNTDLAIWFFKTDYKGFRFTIPDTDISVWNTSNRLEIVEQRGGIWGEDENNKPRAENDERSQ